MLRSLLSASLNASQTGLGSRAFVNPFTGAYPTGSGLEVQETTAVTHTTAHRTGFWWNMSDLNTTLNPGATYYAEAQYVTPHEYAWCQANPGQCNMYNNASYRRFNVTGTTSFSLYASWIDGANEACHQCLAGSDHQYDRAGSGSRRRGFRRLQSDQPISRSLALRVCGL